MDSEIVKGKPLTNEETKFLLDLIESTKIITSKTTIATNNKLKKEAWIRVTERFNATATSYPRTPQQLRLKWENLKKNSRKRSTKIRMHQIKTGGGPAEYIPPDDILDRVTGLLGNTASGFTVPFGGDREPMEFDVGGGNGESSGVGIGEATVSVMDISQDLISILLARDNDIETLITKCQDPTPVDKNVITPHKFKRLTFSTPRAVKKKFKPDESRTAMNTAIAEYYSAKKQLLDAKFKNVHIENEKLLLETEKLKLELDKLKKP